MIFLFDMHHLIIGTGINFLILFITPFSLVLLNLFLHYHDYFVKATMCDYRR